MTSPTPEQQAIISAAKSTRQNLMINAYAGTGKTSTLVMMAQALGEPALALVFNKKNALELAEKLPPNFVSMTPNALGHRAWGQVIGKRLTLDDQKVGRILSSCAKEMEMELSEASWGEVRRWISLAQTAGLVPQGSSGKGLIDDTLETWLDLACQHDLSVEEDQIELCREVLRRGIKEGFKGVISFDDQIYLSALFGGIFPRFPLVVCDEAQDLSPLNHVQIRKVATDRLIVVGDKLQSLYAFRGAATNSMEKLRKLRPDGSWTDLPLTVSFRCPAAVVIRQQAHAKGFSAHSSNPQGAFFHLPQNDSAESWSWSDVPANGSVAIICRNNAPLMTMAFKLLRKQVGVVMLGRDIGKGLIALSKKILPHDHTIESKCREAIEVWMANEIGLAKAKGQGGKLDGLTDRGESLLAVLDSGCRTSGELRAKLKDLFARETGRVTLSTIHRAKGLEWETVILLDPWRVPSKNAFIQGGIILEQELNAKYVADTRTKNILIYANVKEFL